MNGSETEIEDRWAEERWFFKVHRRIISVNRAATGYLAEHTL